MTEQILASLLAVVAHYGPWAGLALSLGIHLKARRAKTRKEEEFRTQTDSLTREYETQRSDDERRFREFKELYHQKREEDSRRFEQVVQMYEKNVDLVKAYQKLAEDQMSMISLTIKELEKANQIAMNNLYCPQMRIQEKTVRTMEQGPK